MTNNNPLFISYESAPKEEETKRKHGNKSICPKAERGECEFDDCECFKPHYRTSLCCRDRRDNCPTCIVIFENKKRKNYEYNPEHKYIARKKYFFLKNQQQFQNQGA